MGKDKGKNDSLTPQKKANKNRLAVVISILLAAVLLVADLYVMIHVDYVALAVITVLLLVSVYFFINAILKEIQEGKKQTEEQYEMLFKSGKASYLLLKKALDQLDEIDTNTKSPANDIITAQKAIAKVTITRSKENADALMNSNDRLLDQILQFEERIDENQKELLGKQQGMLDDSVKELMTRQEEFAAGLKELQDSVKSNLTQTMDSIEEMKNDLTKQNAKTQEQVMAATAQIQNIPTQMPVLSKEQIAEELPIMEEELPIMEEELPIVEEDSVMAEPELDFGADSLDFGVDELNIKEDNADEELNLADSLGETESIDFIEDFEETEPKEDLSFLDHMDLEAELNSEKPDQEDNLNLGDGLDFETDSLDLGADGLDLGADGLDIGAESLDLGAESLEAESLEAESLDLGAESLDLGAESLEADNLDFGVDSFGEGIDFGDTGLEENIDTPFIDEPISADISETAAEEPLEDIAATAAAEQELVPDSNIIPMTPPEPAEKEEPSEPDLSDPHKMMTPDEIAALIANM